MTLGSKIAWDDTVLPFQLDASDMRGRVARLDGVLDGILKQHNYPPQVEALIEELRARSVLNPATLARKRETGYCRPRGSPLHSDWKHGSVAAVALPLVVL